MDGTFTPTKERGEFYGLLGFTNRLHISILHELFGLIRRNREILDDPVFKKVLKQTPKVSRQSWESLVEAALHGSGEYGKAIELIRHKIGFHYDSDQILKGYEHFFQIRRVTDRAFLSRGRSLSESRFYFADAAAESYMALRSESNDPQALFQAIHTHTTRLVVALQAMVTTFLTIKVGGFREAG